MNPATPRSRHSANPPPHEPPPPRAPRATGPHRRAPRPAKVPNPAGEPPDQRRVRRSTATVQTKPRPTPSRTAGPATHRLWRWSAEAGQPRDSARAGHAARTQDLPAHGDQPRLFSPRDPVRTATPPSNPHELHRHTASIRRNRERIHWSGGKPRLVNQGAARPHHHAASNPRQPLVHPLSRRSPKPARPQHRREHELPAHPPARRLTTPSKQIATPPQHPRPPPPTPTNPRYPHQSPPTFANPATFASSPTFANPATPPPSATPANPTNPSRGRSTAGQGAK